MTWACNFKCCCQQCHLVGCTLSTGALCLRNTFNLNPILTCNFSHSLDFVPKSFGKIRTSCLLLTHQKFSNIFHWKWHCQYLQMGCHTWQNWQIHWSCGKSWHLFLEKSKTWLHAQIAILVPHQKLPQQEFCNCVPAIGNSTTIDEFWHEWFWISSNWCCLWTQHHIMSHLLEFSATFWLGASSHCIELN